MRVEVYRNLRKDCWSVRDMSTGKVVAHCKSVGIRHANLVVQKAGRQKVLETKQKNVHAFVRGYLILYPVRASIINKEFTYDPYENETFIDVKSGTPLRHAGYVYLNARGKCYYAGDEWILPTEKKEAFLNR
jgi:hypothetical protein